MIDGRGVPWLAGVVLAVAVMGGALAVASRAHLLSRSAFPVLLGISGAVAFAAAYRLLVRLGG